jgi:hypothetical protein
VSEAGNIKPGSKRRQKACLEVDGTLRPRRELTENALAVQSQQRRLTVKVDSRCEWRFTGLTSSLRSNLAP